MIVRNAFCVALLVACMALFTQAGPIIKIGAIFHEGDEDLERAFDLAIRDIENKKTFYTFTLQPYKKYTEVEVFKATQTACELLAEGIAALFGPSHPMTRDAIAGIVARFEIPYFEYSYRQSDHDSPWSLNVYPNARDLEEALAEIVRHMSFQRFTFIYQGHDALSRMQIAMENLGRNDYPITLRSLMPLREIKRLPESQRELPYETLVKEIQKSKQLSMLIDVETENLSKLLDYMKNYGLMTDYFMCLIVNLDAANVDVSKFIDETSIANMTYFKFINPRYAEHLEKISVEASLLYDAVFAFADAMNNLYNDIGLEGDTSYLEPKPLTCTGEARYKAGVNLTNMVVKKTRWGKMTGFMNFNENTTAREFHIEVWTKQADFHSKVGEWKNGKFMILRNEKEANTTLSEAMKQKKFKVATRVGAPYLMPSEDDTGRLIGDRKYEGYCIDLIAKIEEHLGIKCIFEIVDNYGSYNPQTKQWDGLIKQLLDRRADMAICDLTITSERQRAVDFTSPFMHLGISVLFSKPERVQPNLFSFMKPFSTEVWIYIVTAYFGTCVVLFCMAKVAPGEWVNPHPCDEDPEELENTFNISNSMWLIIGCLMQQGCDILPRTISIRILCQFYWFFILIVVSSYTANMAAFLTSDKMEDSVHSIDDLAKQNVVKYGAVKDGATFSFFKNSNASVYQRIYNTMMDNNPSTFASSNNEGVDRVLTGKRKYAFIMESTTIEYQTERHCELVQLGEKVDSKGYGIALPPNSPYKTKINTALLHFQEQGELQQLKNKWWKEKGGGLCDDNEAAANSNELGMPHVRGLFFVLLCGCGIALTIAIFQFLYNIWKLSFEEHTSLWRVLIREVKFAIKIFKCSKPITPKKQSNEPVGNKNDPPTVRSTAAPAAATAAATTTGTSRN